jgi:hypothetical protein
MARQPATRAAAVGIEPEGTSMPSAIAAGYARPSLPVSVFAEDLSLLIRHPRRLRIARSIIRVLS